MITTVKYNKDTDESYLDLEDILKDTNTKVEDVKFYSMEEKDKQITLVLYDKDKKQVKVESI